jgi:transposase-like protein
MRQKSGTVRSPAEQVVKDIRRATRRHFSAEDKIRIVLDALDMALTKGDRSTSFIIRNTPRSPSV